MNTLFAFRTFVRFSYFQTNYKRSLQKNTVLRGDLCKNGPGHFASEKSFPSNLKFLELLKVKAAKGPFLTSYDIENFKS